MEFVAQAANADGRTPPGSEEHAARRLDALPVDPAALVRQQRRDEAADVVRHAGATQRGLRGDEGVDLRIVADRPAAEVGLDGAGRDRVDRDASAISGSSAWVKKNTPLKWTFRSRSNWASVVSAKPARTPIPALFTRKSNRSRRAGRAAAP